jgi:hypothetical protein
LSPTTPEWLRRPLMLPLPPTPAISSVVSSVVEIDLASDATRPSPLPPCYSPSIYSASSWRDSTITLFEEDIQPVGLGIGLGVEEQAGYSRASVHTARASTIVRVDSNKSTVGLLEIATVL